MIIVIIISNGN